MYEKKIPENLDCGISVCMKVMGGKWKAWIIESIHDGIRRPSEIHRQMETEGASYASLPCTSGNWKTWAYSIKRYIPAHH